MVRTLWMVISSTMLSGGFLALYNMGHSSIFDLPLQNLILVITATILLFAISFAGFSLALVGEKILRLDAQTRSVLLTENLFFKDSTKSYDFSDFLPPSVFFHEAVHDEDTSRWGLKFEIPRKKAFIHFPMRNYPDFATYSANQSQSREQDHLGLQKEFTEKWRENISQLLNARLE